MDIRGASMLSRIFMPLERASQWDAQHYKELRQQERRFYKRAEEPPVAGGYGPCSLDLLSIF